MAEVLRDPRVARVLARRRRQDLLLGLMVLGGLLAGMGWGLVSSRLLDDAQPLRLMALARPILASAGLDGAAPGESAAVSRGDATSRSVTQADTELGAIDADRAGVDVRWEPVPEAEAVSQRRRYNGGWIEPVGRMTMTVTAYSPDEQSCGAWADGMTASGKSVWTHGMRFVAADTRLLPFGTLVSVPGYHDGQTVPVLDRGGAIKGRRLDVIYPTHDRARLWGRREVTVTLWDVVPRVEAQATGSR